MIDAAPKPQLVPLSVARHGMRRWRRFSDYGWARGRRAVPVVLAEAEAVAAALPLVFAIPDSGSDATDAVPQPVALLRLGAAGTPFIDAAGQWLAAYVPALLRVYPFEARPAPASAAPPDAASPDAVPGASGAGAGQGDGTRMILLVDEGGGFITDDMADARFFDPLGTPDPALQAVVDFFRHYETSARATRTACAALAAAGLFVPLAGVAGRAAGAESGSESGSESGADSGLWAGLWGIDRAALAALDDAAFLRLRAAGALDLAAAHFVGRAQLDFLRRAEAALAAGAVPGQGAGQGAGQGMGQGMGGHTPAAPGADVSDFLAALAAAQDDGPQGHAADAEPDDSAGPDGRKGQR